MKAKTILLKERKEAAKPVNTMRLEFDAKSINESFARGTVAAFAAQIDPTVDEVNDLKTAVSEAVTNCVVHAYGDTGHNQTVEVICELFHDRISVTVRDKGRGIPDVERAMQPFHTTKPNDERSGMGFTVMQSFMDSLDVQSQEGRGTTVVMQKFFKTKDGGMGSADKAAQG